MPKPLKVPSLARSVPKPLLMELREAGGISPVGTSLFLSSLSISYQPVVNDDEMMMK